MQRRRNVAIAGLALAFMVAAFAIGALGLSEVYFIVTVIAALGVWSWTRASALQDLTFRERAMKGFVAFAIIGFVLLAAFELGQLLGGHT